MAPLGVYTLQVELFLCIFSSFFFFFSSFSFVHRSAGVEKKSDRFFFFTRKKLGALLFFFLLFFLCMVAPLYPHTVSYPMNPPPDMSDASDDDLLDVQDEAFMNEVDQLFDLVSGGGGGNADGAAMRDNGKVQEGVIQEKDFQTGEVVETDGAACAAAKRSIGDFEVFRLARQGGNVLLSCFEIAQLLGIDVKTAVDNAERNVLHYAADSGDVKLVSSFCELGVPVKEDAKGMTPAHIAVLVANASSSSSRADAVEALLAALTITPPSSSSSSSAPAATSSSCPPLSLEERQPEVLLRRWAPVPPRFTFSAPAPSPGPRPPNTVQRFWGLPVEVVMTAPSLVCSAFHSISISLSTSMLEQYWEEMEQRYTPSRFTLDAWSLPFSKTVLADRKEDLWVATTTSTLAEHTKEKRMGQVWGWRMHDGGNKPPASLFSSSSSSSSVLLPLSSAVWVGMLSVHPRTPQQGNAVPLLRHLLSFLVEKKNTEEEEEEEEVRRGADVLRWKPLPASVQHVLFAVPETPLPGPTPSPLCLVKLFRRSTQPLRALRWPVVCEQLYPEYAQNHCILRADIALKESVGETLRAAMQASLSEEWECWAGKGGGEEDVQALLAFLHHSFAAMAPNARYAVALVPSTLPELRRSLLAPGMVTCVRREKDTRAILDVVTYRVRVWRASAHQADAVAPPPRGDSPPVVAEVVYAHLPTLSAAAMADKKMQHVLLVAEKFLDATTVLVPTLFGITESDVGKAHFTECVSLRRLLYMVDRPSYEGGVGTTAGEEDASAGKIPNSGKSGDVVGASTSLPVKLPVPSSKVSIPFLF